MVIEQAIMVMPFIIMQQAIMPPAIIFIMFCIMPQCILSSHVHMIFMPPSHFSIFIVQRGIIIMLPIAGIIMGMPGVIIEGISGIVLVMSSSLQEHFEKRRCRNLRQPSLNS
jgi:hypothetical protein